MQRHGAWVVVISRVCMCVVRLFYQSCLVQTVVSALRSPAVVLSAWASAMPVQLVLQAQSRSARPRRPRRAASVGKCRVGPLKAQQCNFQMLPPLRWLADTSCRFGAWLGKSGPPAPASIRSAKLRTKQGSNASAPSTFQHARGCWWKWERQRCLLVGLW